MENLLAIGALVSLVICPIGYGLTRKLGEKILNDKYKGSYFAQGAVTLFVSFGALVLVFSLMDKVPLSNEPNSLYFLLTSAITIFAVQYAVLSVIKKNKIVYPLLATASLMCLMFVIMYALRDISIHGIGP